LPNSLLFLVTFHLPFVGCDFTNIVPFPQYLELLDYFLISSFFLLVFLRSQLFTSYLYQPIYLQNQFKYQIVYLPISLLPATAGSHSLNYY
jgi:hypothetical protein